MEPLLQTVWETWRFILCSCRTRGHHARSRGRGLITIKWLLNYKARVADKTAHKAGLSGFFKLWWPWLGSIKCCGSVYIAFASQTGTTQQQALMWSCNQQVVNVQFVHSVSDLAEAVGRITNGHRFAQCRKIQTWNSGCNTIIEWVRKWLDFWKGWCKKLSVALCTLLVAWSIKRK